MGSHGIKDRVAIVGMGCTPFGEHWQKSADDLMIDASAEAFASAGFTVEHSEAGLYLWVTRGRPCRDTIRIVE